MELSMLIVQLFTVGSVLFFQPPPDKIDADRKSTDQQVKNDSVQTSDPMEEFWPSSRLIHLSLIRLLEDITAKYDLDSHQKKKTRDEAARRWKKFLKENRAALQPLMKEFLEMRLERQPPSKKRIQSWSKRVMPVFEKYQKELDDAAKNFRKVLNPIQRDAFDLDLLQMSASMLLVGEMLREWKQGRFHSEFIWETRNDAFNIEKIRPQNSRKMQDSRKERVENLPQKKNSPDHVLIELDAWEQYVQKFMRDHHLDEGQCDAVRSCLSELKFRAIAHRDRYDLDIIKLEQRIQKHRGDRKDFEQIKEKLLQLYGPIDDLFVELKLRIEQIPTAGQREQAARNAEKLKN